MVSKMSKYYKCLDCGEITPLNKVPKCKCPNLTIIDDSLNQINKEDDKE